MGYPFSAVDSAEVNAFPVAEISDAVFFFVKITAMIATSRIPPKISQISLTFTA